MVLPAVERLSTDTNGGGAPTAEAPPPPLTYEGSETVKVEDGEEAEGGRPKRVKRERTASESSA